MILRHACDEFTMGGQGSQGDKNITDTHRGIAKVQSPAAAVALLPATECQSSTTILQVSSSYSIPGHCDSDSIKGIGCPQSTDHRSMGLRNQQ